VIARRLVIGVIAGLAMACSAIVAGQLDAAEKGSSSSSSSGNTSGVPGAGDRCELVPAAEKNTCSECIASRCGQHVEYACDRASTDPKPWFGEMKLCAGDPDQSGFSTWSCRPYNDPELAPIAGNDEPAKEREATLCIRDQCLNGGFPLLTVAKPGSTGQQAKLEDSVCGQCLRDQCAAILVQCCATSVMRKVGRCAYTADETYKAECLEMEQHKIDGGRPNFATSNSLDPVCDWDMRDCFQKKCLEPCKASR